ncbi:phosphotransferase [Paenibacillus puerhi]|uniref:phosphotransferase n=1 Tax=Paenibacillus puerhi TaxID=2692622 RepID=UPI0013593EDC|nr:phosphotransferase [Paenibacillus puerhi]
MKTNNDEQLARLLPYWMPDGEGILRSGASGMNNTTRLVDSRDGRYVLRVYETHRDESKVGFELAVLKQLNTLPLTFRVPTPVDSRSGESYIRTEDGKVAVLFRYIEGERPSLSTGVAQYSFGQTTALLTRALEQIVTGTKPAYPPYYELDQASDVYYALSDALKFCKEPPEPFLDLAEALGKIGDWLAAYRTRLPQLQAMPHQLIHGDLNRTNMLSAEDGRITAVLDFEFVTRDLRVMEPAVALSDLIFGDLDEEAIWPAAAAFIEGYAAEFRLSREETDVLPLLIQLRRCDVFLHFLYRYWDGIDSADIVIGQILAAKASLDWFRQHGHRLAALCAGLSD